MSQPAVAGREVRASSATIHLDTMPSSLRVPGVLRHHALLPETPRTVFLSYTGWFSLQPPRTQPGEWATGDTSVAPRTPQHLLAAPLRRTGTFNALGLSAVDSLINPPPRRAGAVEPGPFASPPPR